MHRLPTGKTWRWSFATSNSFPKVRSLQRTAEPARVARRDVVAQRVKVVRRVAEVRTPMPVARWAPAEFRVAAEGPGARAQERLVPEGRRKPSVRPPTAARAAWEDHRWERGERPRTVALAGPHPAPIPTTFMEAVAAGSPNEGGLELQLGCWRPPCWRWDAVSDGGDL